MRRRIILSSGILLIVLASVLIVYPFAANAYLEAHNADVVAGIVSEADADSPEILAKRAETARLCSEYNTGLKLGHTRYEDYMNLLNIDDIGTMGVLKVPSVGIALPIYHGTGEEEMHKGAGHMFGSALPVGGEGCNTVLASHSGSSNQRLFSDLPSVQVGDAVLLYVNGETLTYVVDRVITVLPDESQYLDPVPNEDRLTLVTCTPFGINSHRLLVCCRRATEADVLNESEAPRTSIFKVMYTIPIALAAVAIAVVLVVKKRKNRAKLPENKKTKGNKKNEAKAEKDS